MTVKAIQEYYPDNYSHCYGCGRLNEHGMHVRSYIEGEESVCRYTPELYKTGGAPDIIYGGLIASLIDCHCAGSAAAAKLHAEGYRPGEKPMPRFVTASLKVDFLRPTPAGVELVIRAKILEIKNRKVTVSAEVHAGDTVTARGEGIMVQITGES